MRAVDSPGTVGAIGFQCVWRIPWRDRNYVCEAGNLLRGWSATPSSVAELTVGVLSPGVHGPVGAYCVDRMSSRLDGHDFIVKFEHRSRQSHVVLEIRVAKLAATVCAPGEDGCFGVGLLARSSGHFAPPLMWFADYRPARAVSIRSRGSLMWQALGLVVRRASHRGCHLQWSLSGTGEAKERPGGTREASSCDRPRASEAE